MYDEIIKRHPGVVKTLYDYDMYGREIPELEKKSAIDLGFLEGDRLTPDAKKIIGYIMTVTDTKFDRKYDQLPSKPMFYHRK